MKQILKHLYLDFRLLWNYAIYCSFPTLPESHYSSIGTVYFEKGNYRKAINFFLKSDKSHRQRDIAFSRYNSYYLGISYLNLGNLKSAISFFVQYCRLNKNDHQVSATIGWCYGMIGEHDKSLEWYQRSLVLEPEVKGVHIACSQTLAELGRNEEAIKYLESAMISAQGPFEEKILQSLICIVRKDFVGAIEGLHSVITETNFNLVPANLFQKEDIYRLLARCRRKSGDSQAALRTLESAIELSPHDPWLINAAAMEFADQGIRLEEALVLINRALDSQPDNPLFLDTKGWTLFKMGQTVEAKTLLEKSLELLPGYSEATQHLATMTEYLGSGSE